MNTKIYAKDYRVPPGDKVDLEKWPTRVKPIYKSKKKYHKLLAAQLHSILGNPVVLGIHSNPAEITLAKTSDRNAKRPILKDGTFRFPTQTGMT